MTILMVDYVLRVVGFQRWAMFNISIKSCGVILR